MPKYPGISPYDNEKGDLGSAKKRWNKIYVKEIESDTVSGINATIENLATTAENSVSAAVSAKNDAVAAKQAAEAAQTAAETAAAGIQSVVETDVDNTLSIAGVAADAKVTGDWLRDIAKPVTLDTSMPATAYADEYMKVTTDSEGRVLYGVKRDGTFTWQKGVPKHLQDKINELVAPVIDNDEYMYVMLDTEGHVILGVKRDGSFYWQKGVPAPIQEFVANVSSKVESKIPFLSQSAKVFKRVCCCGDSYTSGYIVDSNDTVHRVNEEFAWPHYMETATGNRWINCGQSGSTVITWQTGSRGLSLAQSTGKVQAYTIGLGLNDCWTGLPVGTVADIGTEAQTYCGGLGAIIQALKNISPQAKVFVFTVPTVDIRFIPYNQAVRDVVSYFSNNVLSGIHCIDLYEHIELFYSSTIVADQKRGHYTAVGYEHFAEIIFSLISKYIDENVSDFQDVAFIEYDE